MVKGYFLIITCCCTRVVHIKLTPDLSVKSSLLAFRRFISRCGIPENNISDNFKTFKAVENNISDNFKTFKAVEVQNFMPYLRIKWNFILEKSPWWGGFYERMVRSIKNTLKNDENYMNDENLDESLTPYHLIYVRNIATNRCRCLKWQQVANRLRLNYKKINIILKHFAKRFTNEYLSLLHDRYTYRTGKADENCRLYVGDIVLLREEFVPRMNWRKGKVLKLIR